MQKFCKYFCFSIRFRIDQILWIQIRIQSMRIHITANINRYFAVNTFMTQPPFDRCKKILPKALAVYEENLPAYYNLEYHTAKLIQAMSVFSMQVVS